MGYAYCCDVLDAGLLELPRQSIDLSSAALAADYIYRFDTAFSGTAPAGLERGWMQAFPIWAMAP